MYSLVAIRQTFFLFVYVTILAVMADKYKSKFGHIRHIECEVSHIIYGVIQLFIVTILADKSQKVKSTRRNSGKFLCVSYHIRHARLRRAALITLSKINILLQINLQNKTIAMHYHLQKKFDKNYSL